MERTPKDIANYFFPLTHDHSHPLEENWDAHHELIKQIEDLIKSKIIEAKIDAIEYYTHWGDEIAYDATKRIENLKKQLS